MILLNTTKKRILIGLLISAGIISLILSPILGLQIQKANSEQSNELNESMTSLYYTVESHINTLEEINKLGEYDYGSIQPFLYNSLDAIKNHHSTTLVIYSNKSEEEIVEAYRDEFNQLWNELNKVHNEENNKIKNLDNHIKQLKATFNDFKSYNQNKE